MDIGATKVMGNLAVVDTVLYGRVVTPIQAEGKIVVQQYLIKEDGKWRVATGDQSTVKKVLAANPDLARHSEFNSRESTLSRTTNGSNSIRSVETENRPRINADQD